MAYPQALSRHSHLKRSHKQMHCPTATLTLIQLHKLFESACGRETQETVSFCADTKCWCFDKAAKNISDSVMLTYLMCRVSTLSPSWISWSQMQKLTAATGNLHDTRNIHFWQSVTLSYFSLEQSSVGVWGFRFKFKHTPNLSASYRFRPPFTLWATSTIEALCLFVVAPPPPIGSEK